MAPGTFAISERRSPVASAGDSSSTGDRPPAARVPSLGRTTTEPIPLSAGGQPARGPTGAGPALPAGDHPARGPTGAGPALRAVAPALPRFPGRKSLAGTSSRPLPGPASGADVARRSGADVAEPDQPGVPGAAHDHDRRRRDAPR